MSVGQKRKLAAMVRGISPESRYSNALEASRYRPSPLYDPPPPIEQQEQQYQEEVTAEVVRAGQSEEEGEDQQQQPR